MSALPMVAYVNGEYLAAADAKVSVFDRGFLFADAVYEVTSVLEGRLVDFKGHLQRLHRSLKELELSLPVDDLALEGIHRELLSRNALTEGIVYLQVTRGPAERDFAYPATPRPTLVLFTQAKALVDSPTGKNGIKVITVPDLRWARRDIKTVQLLASSMCKMLARKAGADDAWFVEDGIVTEGTASNAYIITMHDTLVTHPLTGSILHGITRAAVLELARETPLRLEERPFTVDEAKAAKEAFITGAAAFVTPVVELDGVRLGDGSPGPLTQRLRALYIQQARIRST